MTNEEIMQAFEEFPGRLKELITKQGISQKKVAEMSGLTQAALTRYLHGTRIPSSRAVVKLCTALNTTPDYLLLGINTAHAIVRDALIAKIKRLIDGEESLDS